MERTNKRNLEKLPKLYETEEIPLKDKIVHMHLFLEAAIGTQQNMMARIYSSAM